MKIVLSAEEANEMLESFRHPHFSNVVNYITVVEVDPAWAASVLPPPLQPDAPIVTIALSESDQFHGLVLGLQARYGDIVGGYGLAYVMDTDLGVIFGRESLAEPKKLGVTRTDVVNGRFTGTVERFGQEVVRVEADVLGPGDPAMLGDLDNFHFKYSIKADGSGLHGVDLIRSHFATTVGSVTLMQPDVVKFTATPHDIYGEIPVVKPVAAFFATLDMIGSAEYLAHIEPGDFLPYAFMKHDDYRLTMEL